jgi:hypothetical protein
MPLRVAPRLRKPSSYRRTQQQTQQQTYDNGTTTTGSNDRHNLPLGTQILRDEQDLPFEYSCSTSSTTQQMELTFDYDMTTSTGSIDSLRLLEWSLMYYAVERIGLQRCRRLPEPWTIVGVSSRRLDVVDTSFDVNGGGSGGKSDDNNNNDSIHDYNNNNDKHISRGYTHFLYTTHSLSLSLSHTYRMGKMQALRVSVTKVAFPSTVGCKSCTVLIRQLQRMWSAFSWHIFRKPCNRPPF